MSHFLGLDLGTSGLKTLLINAQGQAVASAKASYPLMHSHKGWSEQEPQHWIKATQDTLQQLQQLAPKAYADVKALAISGHMHGATLIDQHGQVLRPCILWNDTRSQAEALALDRQADFRKFTGNIVFPGFTAPKLLWLKQHEPEIFARVYKVLLPKDYLVYWLTGRLVTDMSDAAGTAWLDVHQRQWSENLLAASGMCLAQMPDLLEGSDIVSTLLTSQANALGLNTAVKVIAGAADNAATACAAGAFTEGQGFVSLGTSGVILAAKNTCVPAAETAVHTFCHALPEQWYQMSVSLSATDSLNWLAQQLNSTPEQLATLCEKPLDGPSHVMFLPYLNGERTPHNDAKVRASLFGLSKETSHADLCQGVMEGVCFALRDGYEALKCTHTHVDTLLAMGGGTHSIFWLQTLASCLNVTLALPEQGDYGAALGAARLAMLSEGHTLEEVMQPPPIHQWIEPHASLTAEYELRYQHYRQLYQNTKDILL